MKIGLLDLYNFYKDSKGFERGLYGTLYRLYGGKKEIKEYTKETEWFLKSMYRIYSVEKDYGKQKILFNKDNSELMSKLQNLNRYGLSDSTANYKYESVLYSFRKDYILKNILNPILSELKVICGVLYEFRENTPQNFMVTIYNKSGYMLNRSVFNFVVSDNLLFEMIEKEFVDTYFYLRSDIEKDGISNFNKIGIILFVTKLIDVFQRTDLKII